MSRQKKVYEKKSFESMQNHDDTMAMIFVSMRLSKAWAKLSLGAKNLYIDMKLEYYRQKRKPYPEDRTCFYFNKSIWNGVYGYVNANLISKYITELIELGFIKCIFNGALTRQKSIYQYSDMWRNYGTDKFIIEPKHLNTRGLNKLNN